MKRCLGKNERERNLFFLWNCSKEKWWYRAMMLTSSTLSIFSPDKREELQHDLGCTAWSIEDWKSRILRSIHQDAAKSEIIHNLKASQVLLIMDWAMKFIPTSMTGLGRRGSPGIYWWPSLKQKMERLRWESCAFSSVLIARRPL